MPRPTQRLPWKQALDGVGRQHAGEKRDEGRETATSMVFHSHSRIGGVEQQLPMLASVGEGTQNGLWRS